jgi:hypothetical protein
VSIAQLREALLAHGGTVATVVADGPGHDEDEPLRRAARGPRIPAGQSAEYELLLEMILEGSLLHYGAPRAVSVDDPDLALLLGDQLYALGLSRLAELGDLDAVSELADLISLLAQAQAAGDARLAEEIWQAGAVAIGWGSSPDHEAGKALARAGDPRAVDALARARAAVMTHTADEGK